MTKRWSSTRSDLSLTKRAASKRERTAAAADALEKFNAWHQEAFPFAAQHDLSLVEATRYLDILHGRLQPDDDRESWEEGWFACVADESVEEVPYPFWSVKALCWRLGWLRCAWRTGKIEVPN